MCGGICGPGNTNDRECVIRCNICHKPLRMCSCLSTPKKSKSKIKSKLKKSPRKIVVYKDYRDTCGVYGGDCGQGEKCSVECFEYCK